MKRLDYQNTREIERRLKEYKESLKVFSSWDFEKDLKLVEQRALNKVLLFQFLKCPNPSEEEKKILLGIIKKFLLKLREIVENCRDKHYLSSYFNYLVMKLRKKGKYKKAVAKPIFDFTEEEKTFLYE